MLTWLLRQASTSCVKGKRLSAAGSVCRVSTTAAAATDMSCRLTFSWRRQLSHLPLHIAGASAKYLQAVLHAVVNIHKYVVLAYWH